MWFRAALLALFALGLHAQDLADRRVGIFFGYTYVDAQNPDTFNAPLHLQGGNIGVYVAQNRWLRWRVDFTAGGNQSVLGPGDLYEFGGPEFTWQTGRAVFFAHALAGHGEVDGGLFNPGRSGFAMAFGGGLDLKLNSRLSVRLVDADYLPSRLTGPPPESFFSTAPNTDVTSWNNNTRVSFGLIVKFGHKP